MLLVDATHNIIIADFTGNAQVGVSVMQINL